jgi:hypothetical protein
VTTIEPDTATDAAVRIAVLFRPGKGRWKKVGTAATYAEAVALVNAAGDWWLRVTTVENDDAGPTLFDEEAA